MLEAVQELPLNFGFLGKGNDSLQPALMEPELWGLKLHEDEGSTPATIEPAPNVDDKTDTQVAIHTDALNECGFVDYTQQLQEDQFTLITQKMQKVDTHMVL